MPGDAAAIDLSVLATLLGDDQQKVRRFAVHFLDSLREGVRDMEDALGRGDVQTVCNLGQSIKSAARSAGAFRIADLCQDLERLAPRGLDSEMSRALPMVEQLKDLMEQVAQQVLHGTVRAAEPIDRRDRTRK